MTTETREYCDLCNRDVTFVNGGMTIYRGKFRRFFHWKGDNDPREDQTICGPCWNRLASELREAREAHNQEREPS